MEKEVKYWELDIDRLLKELNAKKTGLTSSEAQSRLKEFGLNDFEKEKKRSALTIFISQFKNALILLLVFASIIAAFLGELVDALVILAILLLNAILGFIQEYKSEKAVRELKKYLSIKAKVIRDGKRIEIDSRELVNGDIVLLDIGDIVPADIRLIHSEELSANESVLTGESLPVEKKTQSLSLEKAEPQDIINSVFMGTNIASGSGYGIVVATGKNTFFGKTASYLKEQTVETDFEKSIKKFGKFLLWVTLIMTLFIFIINAFLKHGLLDSFLFALALAVGITPEVLPIIITITMANGAVAMAKEKVIIKRLEAIENLGNIDVLCADKTGTLTVGDVVVKDFFDINNKKNKDILTYGVLCNSAIEHDGKYIGNPIDTAILKYSKNNSVDLDGYKIIGKNEFDFERRRMSVLLEHRGRTKLIAKGGPEPILEICDSVLINNRKVNIKNYKGALENVYVSLAKGGYRVIAVAVKNVNIKKTKQSDEKDMTFIGFITFFDPPKDIVKDTLKHLNLIKVNVKILSGDDPYVTAHICRDVGIEVVDNKVIVGRDLEEISDVEFSDIVEKYNVFARVSPEQKLKIIKQLSANGHVTGFLGDGINDAPALKAADVGISVDSATGVAKDAADVIILQKSLHVILAGIMRGRKIFGNITKYVFITVSANYGNMLSLASSSLFLKFIPMLPSQVLLINFLSDMPMLAVSTDRVDENMLRKPKKWNIKLIEDFMLIFGPLSSIFDYATFLSMLFLFNANISLFRSAWFIESVMSTVVITYAVRTRNPFYKSRPSKLLMLASLFALFLTFFVVYSPINNIFGFVKLSTPILFAVLAIVFVYFISAELIKRWFFKKYNI